MEQSNLMIAIFIVVIAYLCSTFSNLEEFNEIQKISRFWLNLTEIVNRSSTFQTKYDLLRSLPTGDESWRNYRRVEVQLLKWHYEMYSIQTSLSNDMDTAHTKLLLSALANEKMKNNVNKKKYNNNKYDNNNDNNKKYDKYGGRNLYDDDDDDDDDNYDANIYNERKRSKKYLYVNNKKYAKYGDENDRRNNLHNNEKNKLNKQQQQQQQHPSLSSPSQYENNGNNDEHMNTMTNNEIDVQLSIGTLKWLTHILTIYTIICVITSVSQNSGLIILTLALTLILMPMVFKGKQINDNLTDAIVNLRLRQVQLAGVFPSSSKSEMIAQHLILQKIDVIADYWETQTLGLKFKIPFIEYEISLEDEVLGGMIIANILKLLEIFVFPSFGGDNNGTTKSDNNDVVDINDNSTYTSNNNLVGNTRRNTVTPALFSR